MIRTTVRFSYKLACNLAVLSLALAAALPAAAQSRVAAYDRGSLDAREATTPMSVTIALALPKLAEAEKLQQALYTAGDAQYHKFLTSDEFVARFAPSSADVAKVTAALENYGLKVEKTSATTLRATGLPAVMERTFQVTLHDFELPAHGGVAGATFHAPLARPVIPAEISSAVTAVVGLSNSPAVHPNYMATAPVSKTLPQSAPVASSGDPFDALLTVANFASYYDVNPLYKQGISGAGRTLGILTFAGFTPSDAFAYWSAVGLTVNPNRITVVPIDTPTPLTPNDNSGSIETTLDVEQSGGVAPGANIIVYEAPNTLSNFVDVYAAVVEQNRADTFSTSWGTWEIFYDSEFTPVTFQGETVAASQAIHQLLLRASLQGQSSYAATGDGGAYIVNDILGCIGPYSPSPTGIGSCSLTLSVEYPSTDPLTTAAGGTTLAGLQEYCLTTACTGSGLLKINVPHERVWGWDYLEPLCAALGLPEFSAACGIFPAGSTGGVSVQFTLPLYQLGVFGTQLSQPGQVLKYNGGGGGNNLDVPLPAFYPGRNVPDISFNADPQTGYAVFYTSSSSGELGLYQYGGTSFVAPQLNGVSALYDQDVKKRIGLINNTMYPLALTGLGYFGPSPAFHAIAYGDNWFYQGSNGYNPGVGIGTLDVANFAQVLKFIF
jgi:kumamolisin